MAGTTKIDLGTNRTDVIAISFDSNFDGADMAAFIAEVRRIREDGGKARVYLDLQTFQVTNFDLGAAREKLANMGTIWNGIERVAYVVDQQWLAKLVGLVDAITPMHIRAFGHDQQAEARDWVLAD